MGINCGGGSNGNSATFIITIMASNTSNGGISFLAKDSKPSDPFILYRRVTYSNLYLLALRFF